MLYTLKYNLKKPTYTDPRDVQDFNGNADIIDAALDALATGKMTLVELNALIVNGLAQTVAGKLLDATQGKALKDLIDANVAAINNRILISNIIDNLTTNDATKVSSAKQVKVLNDTKAAKPVDYSVSVPTSGWSASAPFTQTITVTNILATDVPLVDVVLSTTMETRIAQREAYGYVAMITTAANSITITCDEDRPTVDLQLTLRVMK